VISKQFTDLGAPSGTANITTILQNTTLDDTAKHLLETTYFPSNRELFKVLRLARTIADFDRQNTVTHTIVQEALKMHQEPLFYPCISE
jgi:predicted ATPase with chaperone activity